MRILLVKVSSLGDVVHAMPIVQDLRRAVPGVRIDWVVEEGFADLVRAVDGVDQVIVFALRRWRRAPFARATWREIGAFVAALRARSYDLVIDAQGLLKTAIVAAFARGPVAGLANRTEGSSYEWPVRFFYARRIAIAPHTHVVDRGRELAARALGYALPETVDFGLRPARLPAAESRPDFRPESRPESRPYVVLIHATSRADKAWAEERWIALGARLARVGYRLDLPWGSPAERDAAERLAGAMRAAGAEAVVLPRLDLVSLSARLDGAAAVVGVDTGLVHIAAALDRPTVELYNFDTAWRTGGTWSARTVNLGGAGRSPTVAEVCAALATLGVLAAEDGPAAQGAGLSR